MVHQYQAAVDAFEKYHLQQEQQNKENNAAAIGPALPALGHALSGAIGSAIANVITYPLDLTIKRLQVQQRKAAAGQDPSSSAENVGYDDVFDAVKRIYAEEGGISAFYAGCAQDTVKSLFDSFLFFLAYDFIRKSRMRARSSSKLPVQEEILVGMVAGAFAKAFTTPISNIVTRKQTASMFATQAQKTKNFKVLSTTEIARRIYKEKGLKGFWSGYSASLILTINPALTMLFHKTLTRLTVPHASRENPGARITFLLAALSKALASSMTYPVQLAKSRAQVSGHTSSYQSDKDDGNIEKQPTYHTAAQSKTIVAAVVEIAKTEGIAGLYQGLSGEIVKGFFSHGLTMAMKERVHFLVVQSYFLLTKNLNKDKVASVASSAKTMVSERASDVQDQATKVEAKAKRAYEITEEQLEEVARKSQRSVGDVRDKVKEMSGRVVDIMIELIKEGKEAKSDFVTPYVGLGDGDD